MNDARAALADSADRSREPRLDDERLAVELAFLVVVDRQKLDRVSPENRWTLPSALWVSLDDGQKDGWRATAHALAARLANPEPT
jgi:hypothetical protein